jgi:prophage DNA circulation protein
MFKADAMEAVPIVNATLNALLAWAPTRGRDGSNLRTAVNDVRAHVMVLLQTDSIGPPLANCFALAKATGASVKDIEIVRATAAAEQPQSAGAILIRDSLIMFCLETQARILIETEFVSREDVEQTRAMFNESFGSIAEDVADRMDAMTYRAIVQLHAAVAFFLVETARPLPRMLHYQFSLPLPTLAIAHKLYADAGRADELRAENKVVHPAFSARVGRALSN